MQAAECAQQTKQNKKVEQQNNRHFANYASSKVNTTS